ncbi:MAG: CPBP family intramembrane metalloprotease [Proteobacteria bacterium]|nr:CPBP family intramembrane metalloprotease [Pseudomonadota bacterium]
MTGKKTVLGFVALFILIVYPDSSLYAISRLKCLGAGLAELYIPGMGYAITRQWDKAVILGGSRWFLSGQVLNSIDSDNYQKEPDDIYHIVNEEDSNSGQTEVSVYLNKATWEGQLAGSLYGNLLLTSWSDLYMHRCQPNTTTYSYLAAPFQFSHFYKKWQFWVPTLLALQANFSLSEDSRINYYLGKGLTENQLRRDSFPKYGMVGVGEEMFFRGAAQTFFYQTWQETFGVSPSMAHHLGVFTAAAFFGAAHDGTGFSADFGSAFIFGIYEGYVYQPSINEFDLTTAIAIHAWYDIILTYAIYNNATFHELDDQIEIPLMRVAFTF